MKAKRFRAFGGSRFADNAELPERLRNAIRHEVESLWAAQKEELIGVLRAELRPRQNLARNSYSVEEVAGMLGKKVFTVREWCRLGRMRATKPPAKLGGVERWRISSEEVSRYQDEGLLPINRPEGN